MFELQNVYCNAGRYVINNFFVHFCKRAAGDWLIGFILSNFHSYFFVPVYVWCDAKCKAFLIVLHYRILLIFIIAGQRISRKDYFFITVSFWYNTFFVYIYDKVVFSFTELCCVSDFSALQVSFIHQTTLSLLFTKKKSVLH